MAIGDNIGAFVQAFLDDDSEADPYDLLTDEEKQQLVYKYSDMASSALHANLYRLAGLSEMPFPYKITHQYIHAETDGYGQFGGTMKWVRDGRVLKLFKWEDINMSKPQSTDPIKHSMWCLAVVPMLDWRPKMFLSRTVMFFRQSWYRMYILGAGPK
jgi:hypothetical protein